MRLTRKDKEARRIKALKGIIWLSALLILIFGGVFKHGNSVSGNTSGSFVSVSSGSSSQAQEKGDAEASGNRGENPQTADELVAKFADKFGSTTDQKSRLRYLLHCLLYRESRHYNNRANGDNGQAGGPLQFHEYTFLSMRRQMMSEGLIGEIGSRYNPEDAIETGAWALANGLGNNWGPILRRECR